jgi:serine phosphatase RsbU (regulator of sigma subunit)
LQHLNAGHNPPLVVRTDGSVQTLAGTGPLVTAMGGQWDCGHTDVKSGDVVVMYTDGLVEGRDEVDEEVGDDQVVTWCQELAEESKAEPAPDRAGYIARGLLGRARNLSVDLRRDDVTVVVAVAE